MIVFTVMNIDFIKSYQNFQQVLFLVFILFPEFIVPSGLLRLMDVLTILFCTIPGIFMVNLDIIFMQGRIKLYYERHWRCPRQK